MKKAIIILLFLSFGASVFAMDQQDDKRTITLMCETPWGDSESITKTISQIEKEVNTLFGSDFSLRDNHSYERAWAWTCYYALRNNDAIRPEFITNLVQKQSEIITKSPMHNWTFIHWEILETLASNGYEQAKEAMLKIADVYLNEQGDQDILREFTQEDLDSYFEDSFEPWSKGLLYLIHSKYSLSKIQNIGYSVAKNSKYDGKKAKGLELLNELVHKDHEINNDIFKLACSLAKSSKYADARTSAVHLLGSLVEKNYTEDNAFEKILKIAVTRANNDRWDDIRSAGINVLNALVAQNYQPAIDQANNIIKTNSTNRDRDIQHSLKKLKETINSLETSYENSDSESEDSYFEEASSEDFDSE